MKKVFYITKKYLEETVGCKNIVTNNMPITVVNNVPMVAKMWKWESENALIEDTMFSDIRAIEGILYLYDLDTEKLLLLANDTATDDQNKWDFVTSPGEADEIMGRFYVPGPTSDH